MAPTFSERIARLEPSVVREILAAAQAPGVISFAGGLPAPESLPSLTGLDVPSAYAQYGATEGEPRLREAISRYLSTIGLECPPARVLVLSGSQQGIDLVAKLFVDVGAPIITESPTYLAALQVFRLFGAAVHGLPLGDEGVDPDALGRVARARRPRFCYLVPTYQNPTGVSYGVSSRQAVARALDEAALPLFEDDPYREVSFDGDGPRPIASHLERASWVYQSSFSKVFLPGIRLGFLAASPDLFVPLVRLKQAADLHSNRVSQWLALSELESPERAARLDALRSVYRHKRDTFQASLTKHLGALAEWHTPNGGLFFWIRLKTPRDVVSLLPKAIERGVVFVPGDVCFPEAPAPAGYLRLNFSHATPEAADEGLGRLAALLRG
jgi:2-aminoadipate transaminase